MKRILALIVFLMSFTFSYSQEYPRIETDSLGNKIVLMTIEQAQKLDNNTDLLVMFEKLDSQLGSYDSMCLKVIGEKDLVIASQTVQIENLKNSIKIKDDKVVELQKEVAQHLLKIGSLQSEIDNKNTEINLHKGQITKAKWKFAIGGGVGGLLIGLVLGILATH
jgi:peptidoglycan hydrolase CwlO-like protein